MSTKHKHSQIDAYRNEIKLRWNQTFDGITAVCSLIADARFSLSAADWKAFVTQDCPFDYSVIRQFQRMRLHPAFDVPGSQAYARHAPTLLYELCLMSESAFRKGVERGIIHRSCSLTDLKALQRLDKPPRKTARKKSTKRNLSASDHRTTAPTVQLRKY